MKRNIRFVLLEELILFIVVFAFNLAMTSGLKSVVWFLDIPSLLLIVSVLIPGLVIMGEWQDFVKAFSVGIKEYSLLELKNIIGAVSAAQKLTIFAAIFSMASGLMFILFRMDQVSTIGPSIAVCIISGFYAVIIEFFLLPLRLNAERKMNEEMDLGDD